MMYPNSDVEAALDPSANPNSDWWLSKWSSWLATIGAVLLAILGIMTVAFNVLVLSASCALAGILQVSAAGVILAVEGSSVVAFLTFAKPVGMFFDGKPVWFKTAVYAGLTVVPMLTGCSGFWVTLGFIDSAAITALYGMLLIGRKGSVDEMRNAAVMPGQ